MDPQTKLFKNTNINIAYKTNNTMRNLLTQHTTTNHPTTTSAKYNKSGIYQLSCPDCNLKYTGQTGRSFLTRYCEHFRDYKCGNGNSKYAQHLLDNKHSISPIRETVNILHSIKKGKMMDTLEKFSYIHRNQTRTSN